MTTRRFTALSILCGFLALLASPASADTALQVRIREAALDPNGPVRLVVSVTGTAAGQPLTPANVAVREGDRQVGGVAVTPLLATNPQPVSVALALDVS